MFRQEGGDVPVFAFGGEHAEGIGMLEIRSDGTAVVRTDMPTSRYVSLTNPFPYQVPGEQPTPLLPLPLPLPLPDTSTLFHTARAIGARQAAVVGNEHAVESFATDVLGLWRGARWQEPVSTALLGDWISPLHSEGRVGPDALDRLKAEVREIHRQLTPIWRRRVDGVRLWSLDFALGDGMTTYDMVASGPDPYEVLAGALPTDRRIAAVLAELTPVERAVAMAWADPQVSSWTEAASIIVALEEPLIAGLEPVALGHRRNALIRHATGPSKITSRASQDRFPPPR